MRKVLPYPSEEQAAALFKPRETFSLSCIFAGLLIDTYLLGIFTSLLFQYAASGHQCSDSHLTRLCVLGATLTTLGVTGYSWWLTSHRFVANFGRYQPFFEATPGYVWLYHGSLCSTVGAAMVWLTIGVTALFTQTFFTHRAFLINGRNWGIAVAAGALMCTGLVSALAVKIIFASLASSRDSANVFIPTAVWLASTTATDLLITGAILAGLLRSRTGWANTNRMITRLIRVTLEAQTPATLSAVVYLGAFITRKSTAVTIAIVYFQSKLYAVGLLYSLNARALLQTIGRLDFADASSGNNFHSPRPETVQMEALEDEAEGKHARGTFSQEEA